ncbi:MAG: glycoside hydrolase family 27 protein [Bacteroidales bacterium]|nr:glycoside hydrolase family 27 protein [Bacteroidales bacterium]
MAFLTGCKDNVRPVEEAIPAMEPPMGWNSWISFGTSVTEEEVKANAEYMASNLKEHGWEYIVIDAGWYAPGMTSLEDYEDPCPEQLVDEFGRPAVDCAKFPSSCSGKGFGPLAEYIHGLGLKLGIHIMRGIPVQAYRQNTPIKGTSWHARDIADTSSRCDWYYGFYGIDMSRPGAQEYYNSLFEQYGEWGIDYVKADDLLSPVYHEDEINAIHSACSRLSRPVVLSLSPGPAPVEQAGHLRQVCQLWRISEDFWDSWDSLKNQFSLCRKWQEHTGSGHWADADMLPVGPMARRAMRGEPRPSNFTEDEQYTMMSLWAMFRSPLMLGCNLPEMDPFTLRLVTDDDITGICRHSCGNRELFDRDGLIAWYAGDMRDDRCHYVAIFNTTDTPMSDYVFPMQEINVAGDINVMDLWAKSSLEVKDNSVRFSINPHGVKLLKIKL